MIKLIFVHGWGLAPDFWGMLRNALPEYQTECVDLGFFGEYHPIDEEAVYVTHSMGLLWLLKNVSRPQAVIAINGFTKFLESQDWPEGVTRLTLKRMMRGFRVNPAFVWQDFMQKAGVDSPICPQNTNRESLSKGLQVLEAEDVREEWTVLECPKLVISSNIDEIVPDKLTQASFSKDEICYIEGNHMLPVSQTKKVAALMNRFLDNLDID